jgi:type II secretory pathway component GspD/PulD (secretin)
MLQGTTLQIPLVVPDTLGAEVLRVNIDSAALGKRYSYLVVAPLVARREQRVTLAFGYQPLEAALRQLAPSLGQPVVVEGDANTNVQLSVQDQPAKACLEAMAAQVGASFTEEDGAYRIAVK